MAEQVALISVRPVLARVPLLLLALAALYCGWQVMRWGIGNTMAEAAPASYASDPAAAFETAEAATRLAPHDPFTHLTLARLNQISFEPESVPRALAEYERAAALAPNDYLVWMEAGRARAALGDTEGGVAALRRAAELAPNYTYPRWHLGNALLRAGRTEEAFAELRRAADLEPTLRPQVFNLAWQVYAPDLMRVVDAVGRTAESRAQLVSVLAGRGNLEEAQAVWEGLGPEGRAGQQAAADALSRALNAKGQHRRALSVLAEGGFPGLAVGQFVDGGFESEIAPAGRSLFGWQVTQGGAQVVVDARNAHGGRRSLRVSFASSGQVEFHHIAQFLAVEPGTRYRLTHFVKTDELRSTATLAVAVSESTSPGVQTASSGHAPQGTNDWQPVSFEFTTGPKTEGITVRVVRVMCPGGGVCPIYGKIWYDDFNLERAGGRAPGR